MSEPFSSKSDVIVANERLFLTRDEKSVVREGDHRAASLLAPKGGIIPERIAARLGLNKGTKVEPLEKAPGKKEAKAEEPKTVAPEQIQERQTRPENVRHTR